MKTIITLILTLAVASAFADGPKKITSAWITGDSNANVSAVATGDLVVANGITLGGIRNTNWPTGVGSVSSNDVNQIVSATNDTTLGVVNSKTDLGTVSNNFLIISTPIISSNDVNGLITSNNVAFASGLSASGTVANAGSATSSASSLYANNAAYANNASHADDASHADYADSADLASGASTGFDVRGGNLTAYGLNIEGGYLIGDSGLYVGGSDSHSPFTVDAGGNIVGSNLTLNGTLTVGGSNVVLQGQAVTNGGFIINGQAIINGGSITVTGSNPYVLTNTVNAGGNNITNLTMLAFQNGGSLVCSGMVLTVTSCSNGVGALNLIGTPIQLNGQAIGTLFASPTITNGLQEASQSNTNNDAIGSASAVSNAVTSLGYDLLSAATNREVSLSNTLSSAISGKISGITLTNTGALAGIVNGSGATWGIGTNDPDAQYNLVAVTTAPTNTSAGLLYATVSQSSTGATVSLLGGTNAAAKYVAPVNFSNETTTGQLMVSNSWGWVYTNIPLPPPMPGAIQPAYTYWFTNGASVPPLTFAGIATTTGVTNGICWLSTGTISYQRNRVGFALPITNNFTYEVCFAGSSLGDGSAADFGSSVSYFTNATAASEWAIDFGWSTSTSLMLASVISNNNLNATSFSTIQSVRPAAAISPNVENFVINRMTFTNNTLAFTTGSGFRGQPVRFFGNGAAGVTQTLTQQPFYAWQYLLSNSYNTTNTIRIVWIRVSIP